jgi:hypothetical protein
MRKLDDALDENMVGGDMTLKAKMIKDRENILKKSLSKRRRTYLRNILRQTLN